MKRWLLVLSLSLVAACGWDGDWYETAEPAPMVSAPGDACEDARCAGSDEGSLDGAVPEGEDDVDGGEEAGSSAATVAPPPARKVVYRGFLKLQVRRLLEAVEQITRAAEEAGGYVDSVGPRYVVVRVPGADFDAAMEAFAAFGKVLERRKSALDVTARFMDLRTRLEVARQAEARLLRLLERSADPRERLRIIKELKRLGERIERLEAHLATLANLVDYFTITIELEPLVTGDASDLHRSPFAWVRWLRASHTTIFGGAGELEMEVPAGFVLFTDPGSYRALAADTTTLRCGVVDNEPRGDASFWTRAIHHELAGRGEALVAKGEAGALSYCIYRNEAAEPRCYLVGVLPEGERLYVLEVFFPTEEAYTAHRAAVLASLETITTD